MLQLDRFFPEQGRLSATGGVHTVAVESCQITPCTGFRDDYDYLRSQGERDWIVVLWREAGQYDDDACNVT